MGLHIHSLGELPANAERAYYVYLLDYGWHEPLGEALRNNFIEMARLASEHDAVVLQGTVGSHFEDEVLSWHHINNEPADEILPAILITTRHPQQFQEAPLGRRMRPNLSDYPLVLIPLRSACQTTNDVVELVRKVFRDIAEKKLLSDFEIAKKIEAEKGGALVDALVLKPSIAGIGIDLKKLISFFRREVKSKMNNRTP